MATVTSRKIVDKIISHNGDPEDHRGPPVSKIYEYRTPEGEVCWSMIINTIDEVSLAISPYVLDPRLIFEREVRD